MYTAPIRHHLRYLPYVLLLNVNLSLDMMSFYSITKGKIVELNELLKNKKKEYNNIKNTTTKEMWLNDLNTLLKNI